MTESPGEPIGADTFRGAQFIGHPDRAVASPRLRTAFDLDEGHGAPIEAQLSYTAHGVVEPWLNGRRVGDDVLVPGWSSYEWRLRYVTIDVTEGLAARNTLGLHVADGWWRGHLGWTGDKALYGPEIDACAALSVTFADGHVQRIVTNENWVSSASEVVSADLYDGQHIDARLRDGAWATGAADVAHWRPVVVRDATLAALTPMVAPPPRRLSEIRVVGWERRDDGRIVVDFGQNLVGWIRLRVRGDRGDVVRVRHAEVLEDGELATRPLRLAHATDVYILSGGDDEFEPTFTFHGFRYAEFAGLPLGVDIESAAIAVVVSSDLDSRGAFHCSDPAVNRLHENIVWSFRGNSLDVPTDCPQRDERMGWTGDLALFAPTAAFLCDVRGFLDDWLRDLAIEQRANGGRVPYVVPDAMKYMSFTGDGDDHPTDVVAVWGDAAVWVPWALWMAYGEDHILRQQWESMTSHARQIIARLSPEGVWDQGFQFGDWLDPTAPPDQPVLAMTSPAVVATACAYRTLHILATLARVLADDETTEELSLWAATVRDGFRRKYLDASGIPHERTVTALSLSIVYGLVDRDEIAAVGDELRALCSARGYRVSTGLVGTAVVLDALTDSGHPDAAMRMLLTRENPSWLYAVDHGATTIWERWDSLLPDGRVNSGSMTSFNHYALGSIGDWMHRRLGGIAPAAPGYARVLIEPLVDFEIESCTASVETSWGQISVAWRRTNPVVELTVVLPEGCDALVRVRGTELTIGPGSHDLVFGSDGLVVSGP